MDVDVISIISKLRSDTEKNKGLDFSWSMYQRGYKQALSDIELIISTKCKDYSSDK